MLFLKLGGSAITDKTRESTAREDVIRRVAYEIRKAQDRNLHPERSRRTALHLLIGHGSGSFGHFAAKKSGFGQRGNWRAYGEIGVVIRDTGAFMDPSSRLDSWQETLFGNSR